MLYSVVLGLLSKAILTIFVFIIGNLNGPNFDALTKHRSVMYEWKRHIWSRLVRTF